MYKSKLKYPEVLEARKLVHRKWTWEKKTEEAGAYGIARGRSLSCPPVVGVFYGQSLLQESSIPIREVNLSWQKKILES